MGEGTKTNVRGYAPKIDQLISTGVWCVTAIGLLTVQVPRCSIRLSSTMNNGGKQLSLDFCQESFRISCPYFAVPLRRVGSTNGSRPDSGVSAARRRRPNNINFKLIAGSMGSGGRYAGQVSVARSTNAACLLAQSAVVWEVKRPTRLILVTIRPRLRYTTATCIATLQHEYDSKASSSSYCRRRVEQRSTYLVRSGRSIQTTKCAA